MRDSKSFQVEGSGFLMGVVCGAAVGAAVGLLMAPKSGSELRQQLYDSTGRLRRQAVDGYAEVVERGKKAVQQGQETYNDIRQSAVDTAHQAVQAAANATGGRL